MKMLEFGFFLSPLHDFLSKSKTIETYFSFLGSNVRFVTNDIEVYEHSIAYLTPLYQLLPRADRISGSVYALSGIDLSFDDLMSHAKEIISIHEDDVKGLKYQFRGDQFVVKNLRSGNFYIVDSSTRTVFYVGENISSWGGEVHQLIRDMITRDVEKKGVIMVHAGAVVIDGTCLGIGGEKGKGKTTLIASLLLEKNAGYLSNDRTCMLDSGGCIKVYGWPTTCNIAVGTLAHFEKLRQYLPDVKYLDVDLQQLWYSGEKLHLTPQEILAVFDVKFVRQTRLNMFIFPELHPFVKKVKVRQLNKNEVIGLLANSTFTPHDPGHPDWLNLRRVEEKTLIRNAQSLIKSIAEHIECYELKGGPNTRQIVNKITELIST